jgi:hypothetical protein
MTLCQLHITLQHETERRLMNCKRLGKGRGLSHRKIFPDWGKPRNTSAYHTALEGFELGTSTVWVYSVTNMLRCSVLLLLTGPDVHKLIHLASSWIPAHAWHRVTPSVHKKLPNCNLEGHERTNPPPPLPRESKPTVERRYAASSELSPGLCSSSCDERLWRGLDACNLVMATVIPED